VFDHAVVCEKVVTRKDCLMTIGSMPAVFDASLFISEFRNRKKETVLGELATLAHRRGVVASIELLRDTLTLRERGGSTAAGKGTAIPNARSIAVIESRLIVGRSSRGIDWGAGDGQPVHLVLLAVSPAELSPEAHLDFVTNVAGLVRLQRNRQKLRDAETAEQIAVLVQELLS
jgi:mannitol/fructose-specific phosphotransferase system IIA component (Ntr-type)